MPSVRKGVWIAIVGVLALLYVASDGIEFLVEYLWFDAQGYIGVFRTIVLTELAIGFSVGTVVFAFLLLNLMYALRQIGDPAAFLPQEVLITPLGQMLTERLLRRGALVFALVAGALSGVAAAVDWESVLLYFAGGTFDQVEPIFQLDAEFYVFTMPLLERIQSLFWVLGIVSLLGVGFLYFLKMQAELPTPFQQNVRSFRMLAVPPAARAHVAALGAMLLLVMAGGQYLDRFAELYRPGGLFTGPGYADINGTLPMLTLRAITSVIAAVLLVYGLLRQKYKLLLGALGVWAVIWVGAGIYTAALQRFVVSPNEANKEAPFLVHHIAATNRAFDLHRVEERFLDGERELTEADIARNRPTVNNVRLWDHEPLLDTFSQIQEIRTYYEFSSVDNDRYMIGGELRQTMLSPREMQKASLPNPTWVNERMIYTHGHGITMGPVNRVNEQGLPVLFIKNIPPISEYEELQVTRPEIYYGEVVDDYVFVKTDQDEFDYPEGDDNVYSQYVGAGGVGIGGFWRRLLLAAYLRDIKLLLAEDFNADTRILLFRNVMHRIRRIAPFFRYDSDPYMVLHEGRLVWIADAYTLTERFPYAEFVPDTGNYMRNPVKVLVDAYDGRVQFYLADADDPIAAAFGRIFPGMIRPIGEMPDSIRSHIRHPVDYFQVQTFIYATYHMHDPLTFYNKEDQWEVPVVGQQRMEPYYTVMKLPEEQSEEFILMLPFTPRLKDNLAAWMVARSDGEHYGQLVVYRFPKQKLIFGPRQMVARINQDGRVSQQVTLWDQSGSNVIRGTLLVIPIESSLIYVQPLYLKAEDGRIPELKRVIVGYQNEIAMGLDLEDALGQIFSGRAALPSALETLARQPGEPLRETSVSSPGAGPFARALEAYDALQQASRQGDWARFGRELQRLGSLLREIEAR